MEFVVVKLIALETSSRWGSIALLENGALLHQLPLQAPQRTATTLAPGIRECLDQVGWQGTDLEAIAVTLGPGSFTGLRLGVTTAKTLSYVWQIHLVGVNTLEVIAAQTPEDTLLVVPAIDAYRQQTFTAVYERNSLGNCQEKVPACVIEDANWPTWLPPGATLSGSGLEKFSPEQLQAFSIANSELWQPQATTVGQLAHAQLLAGRQDDLWQVVPQYYRQSAAEEKRNQAE